VSEVCRGIVRTLNAIATERAKRGANQFATTMKRDEAASRESLYRSSYAMISLRLSNIRHFRCRIGSP
jgi:hypothetical protein